MARGRKKADQARQQVDEDTIAGRRKNRNVQSIYQRQAEDLGKSQAQTTANDGGQGLNLQTPNAKSETTSQHSRAQDAVERDAVRSKIDLACKMINTLIADNGSRRACRGLVDKLDSMFADTERLNLLAVMPNDAEEFGRQAAIQIALFTQIETAKEDVDGFIDSRADEASSIASFQPLSIRSEVLRNWTQTQQLRQQTSQALIDAKQKAEEAQRTAEKLQKESDDAKQKADEANKEVANLTGAIGKRKSASTVISGGNHDWGVKKAAINDWRRKSLIEPRSQETEEEGEPDCWIDRYCSGLEDPTWFYSHKAPSLKSELPVFSGKALDWFWWIDLYRSMVHDQRISAGEKLAILKSRLSGEQLDIVQGLGGGEPAYKSALSRLKQAAGRRDVMRVAHLSELDRMDLGRDPTAFRRFAEKARTHFFDLTRMGETSSSDIIERLCRKLHPSDRLEWNFGRGTGLERRSLNEFGEWLCERASAYQNAYNIAAEQASGNGFGNSRHRPTAARAHHAIKRRSDSALEGGYVSNVSERSIQPKIVRSEKDAG